MSPVATEVAERRKPDWHLHSEAVRRTLTLSQESKKEIPVKKMTAVDEYLCRWFAGSKLQHGLFEVASLEKVNESGERPTHSQARGAIHEEKARRAQIPL